MNLLPAFTPRTESLIDDIVSFNILPPQIDYTKPYHYAALTASTIIESYGHDYFIHVYDEIERQIAEYYDSPAAYLDTLF